MAALQKVISEFLSGSQATLAERIQKASPISYVQKRRSALAPDLRHC